mmetsp:Transcript_25681/g.64677  ORF Transcript_25681/g.64677 Transcript_25681/m.64677 type:complete len:226 (-) Transcript_25681:1708-2385(-)
MHQQVLSLQGPLQQHHHRRQTCRCPQTCRHQPHRWVKKRWKTSSRPPCSVLHRSCQRRKLVSCPLHQLTCRCLRMCHRQHRKPLRRRLARSRCRCPRQCQVRYPRTRRSRRLCQQCRRYRAFKAEGKEQPISGVRCRPMFPTRFPQLSRRLEGRKHHQSPLLQGPESWAAQPLQGRHLRQRKCQCRLICLSPLRQQPWKRWRKCQRWCHPCGQRPHPQFRRSLHI